MDLNVLKRFLNHSASEEDYKKINKWRREEPANSTFLFSLEEIWSKKEEANYATKIHLNASYQKMIEKMMSRSESKIKEQETYNTTQKNDIHKPKSSLFLKITASIAIVLSVGLGTLYYMEVTRPVGFNTVIVPNSQTANLVLEDGTHIWLNSGSRFTYPTKFARGYRTVKLAGEALFQVNRDEHKPFLVETERLKVRVLGTTFNVKSYSGEDPTVLLKEGQVEVYTHKNKNIRIKPNQMLTVSLETGLSSIREMDASTAGTWRTGELMFPGETLKTIVLELKRKFDREIVIEDPSLEKKRFFCHVHRESTLTEVLDLLQESGQLTYLEKEHIFIIRKEDN